MKKSNHGCRRVPFKCVRSSLLLVLALGMLSSACNSGHWVDGDPLISQVLCDPKQMDQAAKAVSGGDFIKMDAQAICRHAGLAYTGDTRCEAGSGQVKCK